MTLLTRRVALLWPLDFVNAVLLQNHLELILILITPVTLKRESKANFARTSEVLARRDAAAVLQQSNWRRKITAVVVAVKANFCVVNLKDAIVVFIFIVLAFPQFLKAHGIAPYTVTRNTQST